MAGAFLAVDGPDGAGKTTLVKRIVGRFEERGVDAVAVREPGGTRAAELAREGAFTPEFETSPVAELFFMLAARADLVAKIIRPALALGRFVVSDRFELSTLAYQVAGRGLPRDAVLTANELATGGLKPDLTIVLDLDPEVGRERQEKDGKLLDRMEREPLEVHERVAASFRATHGPGIEHVDAMSTASSVEHSVWSIIERRFAKELSLARRVESRVRGNKS